MTLSLSRARPWAMATLVASASLLVGCRGETSKDPPVVPIRNMYDQPRYKMQGETDQFADHRMMRPKVEGAVPREAEVDPEAATGRLPDGSGYVLEIPPRVVDTFGDMDRLLARGKDRYAIYCALCHDATGSGNGLVTAHAVAAGAAAMKPPSYHDARLRHAPDGQIFATISNGVRNMPPYGYALAPRDRWAIVGYMRALQVSQASLGGQP